MFTGPIEDRMQIRDLIDSYTDAVHQRDAAAWADTWTEDALWDLGAGEIKGRANLVAAWVKAMENYSFVAFDGHPGMINVYGARADLRTYTSEFLIGTDGTTTAIKGQYDDRLVKEAGRWRFQSRRYTVRHRKSEDQA